MTQLGSAKTSGRFSRRSRQLVASRPSAKWCWPPACHSLKTGPEVINRGVRQATFITESLLGWFFKSLNRTQKFNKELASGNHVGPSRLSQMVLFYIFANSPLTSHLWGFFHFSNRITGILWASQRSFRWAHMSSCDMFQSPRKPYPSKTAQRGNLCNLSTR